jgi:hypothetical protein
MTKDEYYIVTDWEKDWELDQALLPKGNIKWLSVFPEYRKEYARKLCNEYQKLRTIIAEGLERIKQRQDGWFFREIIQVFFGERFNQVCREIKQLNWMFLAEKPGAIQEEKIPEWKIELAKSVPFSDLVDVNRSGFLKCSFHNDKHASLYTRGGFAYCFGCGWHGDIIKFVMETRGLSFKEAIRFLTS